MYSSQSGHWKLLWINRRCIPTECPKQSVMPLVARNSANAPHEKYRGPNTPAPIVIPPIHNDFMGDHRTFASTGFDASSERIRSEPGTSVTTVSCQEWDLRGCLKRALSFFSGRDTGQTFWTKPFSVLMRFSCTKE